MCSALPTPTPIPYKAAHITQMNCIIDRIKSFFWLRNQDSDTDVNMDVNFK